MVRVFTVCLLAGALVGCSSSTTSPTSNGTLVEVSGRWTGTFGSSNNPSYPISVDLSQQGSAITGTWSSDEVSWHGDLSGSIDSSRLRGTMSFSGTTGAGTVCTGTANLSGDASASSLALSSTDGIVGGSCPAALPVQIKIDLHR